jgi:hypothetical protein
MTDLSRAHLDDEALSAVLDGVGTADEARHVEGCGSCSARLEALRAVAAAVAAPVPAPEPERLDAAVAAALSAQNVVPLSVARAARRPPAWLGAAAGIAAVLAVGGLLGRASDDDTSRDEVAASDSADSAAGADEESGGGDDMATMESDVTADAPVASSLAGTELGELSGVDLRAVVEDRQAQRTATPTTTAVGDGDASGGGTGAAAPCESELRALDAELGAVVFVGEGTWEGELVAVVVFETAGERRAFVAAYDGCAVRADVTWEV